MGFATRTPFDWQLRTRVLALGERTLVMAAVNLTPDSFSGDGLACAAHDEAVKFAIQRLDGGADILDLGAESTRPGALPVSADAEQERLLPMLEAVLQERPSAIISIDTYHASTARAAVAAGAEIVNDVSGLLWDDAMAAACADLQCGAILMHARGRPSDWKSLPRLSPREVLPLVKRELAERLTVAIAAGIAPEHIVLDPGFGFGKMQDANYSLLRGLPKLAALGQPLLAGVSRKSFLGHTLASLYGAANAPVSAREHA